MYVVAVEVKKSAIEGRGVFAKQDISKGEVVWKFAEGHERKMSKAEYKKLDSEAKKKLERVAYLSPQSGMWVSVPRDDPANFTNHSRQNNMSVVFDPNISDEPVFVANRNIKAGEELTNNYREFDENSRPEKFSWL